MPWIKERVELCDDCENSNNTYDFDDIHECCEAGICMLCFQTGRSECDSYRPKLHTLGECIEKYGDDLFFYSDLPHDALGIVRCNTPEAVYKYRFVENMEE